MLPQKNVARSRQEPKAQSNPAQGRNACQAVTPLLTEGDIRAPEVWLRVDIHDRRASPIGVPDCPGAGWQGVQRGGFPAVVADLKIDRRWPQKRTDSFTWAHPILITVPITSALAN